MTVERLAFLPQNFFVIAENLEKMKLVVNVSEADVGKVSENQKVRFTVVLFQMMSLYQPNIQGK